MASGPSHDRATWGLCLPFGLLWWPWQGLAGAACASLGKFCAAISTGAA